METARTTVPEAEEILHKYFPVLDHGFVALVDYMSGDEGIDQAARTSYGAGTRKVSERRGLIRTLRRKLHTSPFEMCELKFHCSMPIVVARQWIRHRTASVNEYSGRYSVMPMLFYTPAQEDMQRQSTSNKQGRANVPVDALTYKTMVGNWNDMRERNVGFYTDMIEEDLARELARIDLPLSTYTQWYWKIDLHNLLHFLGLRCDAHAQKEIRVFADIMAGAVKRLAPLSFEAWIDYFFSGQRMSRMEMNVIRALMGIIETGGPVPDASASRLGPGVAATGRNPIIWKDELIGKYEFSATEVGEFIQKLRPQEARNFDLNLEQAKTGDHFAKVWADAVPAIDRPKTT